MSDVNPRLVNSARAQEIENELRARGAYRDGNLSGRELAEYARTSEAARGHSGILSGYAEQIAHAAASNPMEAHRVARLMMGEVRGLGITYNGTDSDIVSALNNDATRHGLRPASPSTPSSVAAPNQTSRPQRT